MGGTAMRKPETSRENKMVADCSLGPSKEQTLEMDMKLFLPSVVLLVCFGNSPVAANYLVCTH